MRLCIFSDIHGNLAALNRMFEIERINAEGYIFLGDIFGYFYDQSAIIDKLKSIKNIWAVKGNHDENYLKLAQKNCRVRDDLVDSYGSSYYIPLTSRQKEYIEKLPDYLETEIDGQLFGLFHGGPSDYMNQRIYPDTELKLSTRKYAFLLLGHTHYRLAKLHENTLIINPGSLGQPRDGNGFSYLILDSESRSYEFKTVQIDMSALIAQMKKRDFGKKVFDYIKRKYEGK